MESQGKTSYLAAKLARIYNAVKGVKKTGYNEYDKYAYLKEEDLTEPLRDAMSKENIVIIPTMEDMNISVVDTAKGGKAYRAVVKMRFTITDGDTGEKIETTYFGVGDDRGDKGLYKAITGATKYALYKLFLVPTGDDPEAFDDDGKATTPKGATVEQTTEINDLFRTLACDDAKRVATFAWASESRAKTIDGITYEEATKIIASLKKKVKELNK